MLKRFRQHRFHSLVRDIDCTLHLDDFLSPGSYVARKHAKNSILVDFKLHPDSRNSLWRGLKFDFKFAKFPVVARHLAFALQYLDRHRVLIMHRGCKRFARFRRNRRIAWNDHVHQSAKSLDPQREWRNIEKDNVAYFPGQNSRLNRCASGYCFVRVLRDVWFATKNFCSEPAYQWHPRHAANQNDFVEIRWCELRIRQRSQAMNTRSFDNWSRDLFYFAASNRRREISVPVKKRDFDHNFVLGG